MIQNEPVGAPAATEVWHDPIVAEVRKVRDQIAAACDYDSDRILQDMMAWEKDHPWQDGDVIVSAAAGDR